MILDFYYSKNNILSQCKNKTFHVGKSDNV